MTPADRVRRLIESGSVAPEEGERLLAAMAERPASSPLLNPFERFGGGKAATIGAVISAASIAVATSLGVRFDGLLDLHFNRAAPPSLRIAIADQIAAWVVPALGFWAYARAFSRHVRLVTSSG